MDLVHSPNLHWKGVASFWLALLILACTVRIDNNRGLAWVTYPLAIMVLMPWATECISSTVRQVNIG
jgi:hypothetical protein